MCADQSAAQPGVFYDLTTAGALPALVGRYGEYRVGAVPRGALAGVVSAAIAAGANAVAVEPNYVDLDWRSELTAFYSKSFCSYPSFTDRLHFLSVTPVVMHGLVQPGFTLHDLDAVEIAPRESVVVASGDIDDYAAGDLDRRVE